jgi:hypothetical protein
MHDTRIGARVVGETLEDGFGVLLGVRNIRCCPTWAHLACLVDDVDAQLAVDGEQGLIAFDLAPEFGELHARARGPDVLWEETFASANVLLLDGAWR